MKNYYDPNSEDAIQRSIRTAERKLERFKMKLELARQLDAINRKLEALDAMREIYPPQDTAGPLTLTTTT